MMPPKKKAKKSELFPTPPPPGTPAKTTKRTQIKPDKKTGNRGRKS